MHHWKFIGQCNTLRVPILWHLCCSHVQTKLQREWYFWCIPNKENYFVFVIVYSISRAQLEALFSYIFEVICVQSSTSFYFNTQNVATLFCLNVNYNQGFRSKFNCSFRRMILQSFGIQCALLFCITLVTHNWVQFDLIRWACRENFTDNQTVIYVCW